jgi:hypothetical protein
VELVNLLGIFIEDITHGSLLFLLIFMVFLSLTFNTHDTHEIISRVAHLRAGKSNAIEVIYCIFGLVKEDDSPLSQKHKPVKVHVNVGVWLMDGTNNGSTAHSQFF